MAKSAESTRGRRLRRSRNVSSFFEESTENATPPKMTMNVIADVHSGSESLGRRQQRRDNENDPPVVELPDNKETKRSSQSSKSSSRAGEAPRNRSSDRGRSSKEPSKHLHDDLTVESLDLIEEFDAPRRRRRTESPEEKPRRRKQWNTVANVTNETEVDPKRPPRKRWSKDAGVIRLPETSDDASPLIDNSRRTPVPASRTGLRRSDVLHFDNPAFVSDNEEEEEVLRIETDHNRESTKIEMRRLSDRSNFEDEAGTTSGGSSSRRHRREAATTNERLAVDSDGRSSKARSSESRRDSVEEPDDSSANLEKVSDVRSSSIASEGRTSSGGRSQPDAVRDKSSRRKERPLFKKKKEPPSDDAIISSSARDANSTTGADARVRKKRKKKRKQEKEATKGREEEMKFISVTIHRADVLEADYVNAKRPMVRVHIVDARTGSYLKSTVEDGGAYLQPMITGKFDFKKNKSMIPAWEEELIFEHDFNAIVKESDQVVILFEVIELLSFADASLNYDKVGSEGCWNKIAWAFLKPVGANNILHTDKKVRLQLYKPRRSFKKYGKQKCEVYTWWQSNNRDKYPSSLLVTVTSVPPPKLESVLYQNLPLNDLFDNEQSESRDLSMRTSESMPGLPKWARLAAQSCKIPNEKMFETEVSENGCFYVAFSNDGKYLACVHSEEYDYPIVVYEVKTSKIHVRFLGHKAFVYSLSWSSDDHYLLSASADQTALVWDVRNQIVQHVEMLPHPSYVYCAKYGPDKATIVATGCYDRVARIWANDRRSRKRELSQELEGHEGFVNSMVFQRNGNLITADSVGLIILWKADEDPRVSSKTMWSISRKIKINEIEGVVINTIVLHPLESKLLVHSRDNGLRMLDLATGVVLQKYKQLNNQRIQLKVCISPCGGLIMCGGEDSVLNIWNLETGKRLAKYTNVGRNSVKAVITCVDYHPYDHVLAYSIFGSPMSVRILKFDKSANGSDVGLILMEDAPQTRGNEVVLNVPSCPSSRQAILPSSGTIGKENTSSRYPVTGHTVIQIENDREQSWPMLHRLKGIERKREKSRDRLHCIIEKIDSMLSRNSMFFEDVRETKRTLSANSAKGYHDSRTNAHNNVALNRDALLKARSTQSHTFLKNDNDTRTSSFTDVSKSRNCSFDSRNSAASFSKTNTPVSSHLSSPDSAGTYVIEMSNFNKNVDEVAEKLNSVQITESDNSRISNATFVIENERS
ncbi:LOW QUALITY PROTEIN: jouberin-like [Pogonomyrmex barbatus]|uniref:LOW QUALITY PROTEIN: jouberin-like n=1 Tax=Pogonomyrmex barbatus TaxID=144034 RepID=A0A6I9WGJ2_9HYME|nr:LOW QUALITY PROTEIN: jouberin-like [Pogonomyrmex barbatus]